MSKALKEKTPLFLDTHVFTGYQGSVPYLKPKKGAVDNTGRHHVGLYGTCDVCDKEFY
jgi:hypothetical protein